MYLNLHSTEDINYLCVKNIVQSNTLEEETRNAGDYIEEKVIANEYESIKRLHKSRDDDVLDQLYKNAETLFSVGEFENALVLYSRGFSLSPDLHVFKNGLWKTQAAIAKAIGRPLRKYMTQEEKREGEDATENHLEIDQFVQDRLGKWKEKATTVSDRNRTELQGEVKMAVAELSEKLRHLSELHATKSEGAVQEGHNVLKLLYKTKHSILPNKLHYYFLIYNALALSYIGSGRYEKAKDFCEQLMAIAVETGNNEYLCRARCLTAKVDAAFGNFHSAIKHWQSMMQLTQDQHLLAWAFHEMGRCYFELNKIDSALVYAGWSYDCAKSCNDTTWCLHALILMAHSNLCLGDNEEALEAFQEALTYAQQQQPTQDYINRCLDSIQGSCQLRVSGNPLLFGDSKGQDEDTILDLSDISEECSQIKGEEFVYIASEQDVAALKSPTLSLMDIQKKDCSINRNARSLGSMKQKDILELSRQQGESNIGDSSNVQTRRKGPKHKIATFNSWKKIEKEKEKIQNIRERNDKFAKEVKAIYLQNLKPKKFVKRTKEKLMKTKSSTTAANRKDNSARTKKKTNSTKTPNLHPPEWINLFEVEEENFCECGFGLRKDPIKNTSPYARHNWAGGQKCPCRRKHVTF